MDTDSTVLEPLWQSSSSGAAPERRLGKALARAWAGLDEALIVAGNLTLVALIGWLDYRTGPNLSFSIVYLLPVIACAWWAGFPHSILLALAAALTWHTVDAIENPSIPPGASVWNGIVRFGTLALTASLAARLRLGILRERRLARTDALTGAANARTFYETAAAEAERARQLARPLTLAYFDLDNFKQLNDRLGHAAGDVALQSVVGTIRSELRGSDLLARLGGDEFALLLAGVGAEVAPALLLRVQSALAHEMARRGWPVTLSIGAITFLRPPEEVDLMIRWVDALMYDAKRKGKGRLEHIVIQDEQGPWQGRDRRATARILCRRPARVRSEGAGRGQSSEEVATVRDISISGIGLHLERRIPPGAVLVIEPLAPGARALLARVVRTTPDEGGWVHGCVLPTSLSAEEMHDWLDPACPRHS
jgi:diguanylate cyclase (GGDEF)-like protein